MNKVLALLTIFVASEAKYLRSIIAFEDGLISGLKLDKDMPEFPLCYQAITKMTLDMAEVRNFHAFMMTMKDFFEKGSVCFEVEDDVMTYWEFLKTDFEAERLGDLFANIVAKHAALIKKFQEGNKHFADKQYKEAG